MEVVIGRYFHLSQGEGSNGFFIWQQRELAKLGEQRAPTIPNSNRRLNITNTLIRILKKGQADLFYQNHTGGGGGS